MRESSTGAPYVSIELMKAALVPTGVLLCVSVDLSVSVVDLVRAPNSTTETLRSHRDTERAPIVTTRLIRHKQPSLTLLR